jgi:hypothetical protein
MNTSLLLLPHRGYRDLQPAPLVRLHRLPGDALQEGGLFLSDLPILLVGQIPQGIFDCPRRDVVHAVG